MRFSDAIDLYVADRRSQGRINSANTEQAYRRALNAHSDDVKDRDPALTGREDVKKTLRRWAHPNSQRQAHAILTSFYDWTMEEGRRDTNPARMVLRARARPVNVYRLTLAEVIGLSAAADDLGRRERCVIRLGLLAGLRRQELCGLQGRHLARDGVVWVSADIAKGGRERVVPVLSELAPVIEEIRDRRTGPGEFVIPSRYNRHLRSGMEFSDRQRPISGVGLHKMVRRVGRHAGLAAEIGPHTLRHAFGDHVARYAGLRAAQEMLGHRNVATTEGSYTGRVTVEELMVSVHGFAYGLGDGPLSRSASLGSHNVD